jgi:uncharacterized protein with HEPN domain
MPQYINSDYWRSIKKKIPESVRDKYPGVPWREMAGMRDKVTHEYFGVQMKILWNTLRDDIPPLIDVMGAILAEVDSLEKKSME